MPPMAEEIPLVGTILGAQESSASQAQETKIEDAIALIDQGVTPLESLLDTKNEKTRNEYL